MQLHLLVLQALAHALASCTCCRSNVHQQPLMLRCLFHCRSKLHGAAGKI